MKVPLLVPHLTEDDEQAVIAAIRSGWITQGPQVAAFEQEFAVFTGSAYACAVSSATTALHMALLAVGVAPGDEVITVSHSFIATANVVRYCGALPVFVDIEPDTFNMDPALIEGAVSRKTKAILCVHQIGMPCDLESILTVAKRHNLPIVEDAACATGSKVRVNGVFEPIGKPHGDIACFSFHPRKVLTTGDGGMLTTQNAEYDQQFRLLRQHGMSIPDTVRHNAQEVIFESYPVMGYNYRLTDLQAALGRSQLQKVPQLVAERYRLVSRYEAGLADCSRLTLPVVPGYAMTNWQSYSIRIAAGIDQKTFMQKMLDAGINTRRGVMNAHLEPAYGPGTWRCGICKRTDAACDCLRHSIAAQKECVQLPLFPGMTDEQVEYTISTVRALLQYK
jgi:dTDP-4-amino-4,6-dideoxygalactose transaminase